MPGSAPRKDTTPPGPSRVHALAHSTPGRAPLRAGLDQWAPPTRGARHCPPVLRTSFRVCVYYCRTYYKAVRWGGRRRVDDMCYDRRPRRPLTPHERTLHAGTARACTLLCASRASPGNRVFCTRHPCARDPGNKAAASAHGMGSGGLDDAFYCSYRNKI